MEPATSSSSIAAFVRASAMTLAAMELRESTSRSTTTVRPLTFIVAGAG